MADTIYRNHWNPIPQIRHPQSQIHPRSFKPKIVNIPVHFVGSEDAVGKNPPEKSTFSKMDAAVEIQRAVRGFLVRKNVRAIRKVSVEVDGIERKLKEEGFKIRLDPRERVRVSEELMALLFRLDSVRGVRGFRKKVIGRVIKLQEELDSSSDSPDREIPAIDAADPQSVTSPIVVHGQSLDEMVENVLEMEADDTICKNHITEGSEKSKSSMADESLSFNNENARDRVMDLDLKTEKTERKLGENNPTAIELPKRDTIEIASSENGKTPICAEMDRDSIVEESLEEEGGMRKMMKKMAEENEDLKLMVAQLCEASAEQCRLMAELAGRVDDLERLSRRKDRRRKRRSGAACSARK